MRILVVNVAAESSGALTIMHQYYRSLQEDGNTYFICVSRGNLLTIGNLTILQYPWIKKSWLHRLWFDCITARNLIKKHDVDAVFSLQNTILPFVSKPQTVYVQNSLPFVEYRFRFIKEPKLWIYQNIVGALVIKSIKKANKVIVQTKWMKSSLVELTNIPPNRVTVEPPVVSAGSEKKFNFSNWKQTFIYPATSYSYKNHLTLFKAMENLILQGFEDFKVLLTLEETSLPKNCSTLYRACKLQTELLGVVDNEVLMQYLSESILVFPSYIETVGLPLLEAIACNSPIISARTPFAKEILADYQNVEFFEASDYEHLSEIMKKFIIKQRKDNERN